MTVFVSVLVTVAVAEDTLSQIFVILTSYVKSESTRVTRFDDTKTRSLTVNELAETSPGISSQNNML